MAASDGMLAGFPGSGLGSLRRRSRPSAHLRVAVLWSTPAKVCCQSHLGNRHGLLRGTRVDPPIPGLHSVTLGSGKGYDLHAWVDRTGMSGTEIEVEVHVGQQVDLVDEHQSCRGEHVRVLQRLVGSLGYRDDHDLAVLAEIE